MVFHLYLTHLAAVNGYLLHLRRLIAREFNSIPVHLGA